MAERSHAWGPLDVESEVASWLRSLADADRNHVAFYIDLLQERGPTLDFPYTSQLRGRLRELRFYLRRQQWRITYFISDDRHIVLLTAFRKTRRRETAEIARALRLMEGRFG